MKTVTVTTNPEILKEHHPDAIRLVVVHFGEESWYRYLILDRAKVCKGLRKLRIGKRYRRWYIRPDWAFHYRGPGLSFSDSPYRVCKQNRRFVTYCQHGGIDI